ncbi:MAG: hypothetical protein ACRYGI_05140 [Janthinobacterium lividum]
MTQPRNPNSTSPDRAEADRQSRLVREAAALRENLRRRKQQTRARQDCGQDSPLDTSTTTPDPIPD